MNQYNVDSFLSDLEKMHITLSREQTEQFLTYYELLVEWNSFMNLTAITEYQDVMKKHFVDSLSLHTIMDLHQPLSVIDVGTGAGFPGLALKIAFPELKVTLLDSLNKRVTFLNTVIEKLGLSGIKAVHGRAEDYIKQGNVREQFDLCVSRAVSNLATLSEYCMPYVKVGGKFIPYKSEKIHEEITEAGKAITILGGQMTELIEFHLPDSDLYRCFPVIEKKKETPKKYPRKAGLPTKEPIK